MPKTISEPIRDVPVIHEADVCVLGGSCTGLLAAVRAARLGASVVLVEKQNSFGGVATNSMVNAWHSLMDINYERPIIAGLTAEVCTRLEKRDAIDRIEKNEAFGFIFNSEELKIELDELTREHRIKIYLHTMFCAPHLVDGRLAGVLVENKTGRGAILARAFIDATGDADLCARLPGIECYYANHLQPATACARIEGWRTLLGESFDTGINSQLRKFDLGVLIREHGDEFGIPQGMIWGCYVPHSDIYMLAGTRIYGANPAKADDLTEAEIEGRRQIRAILDLLRKYRPDVPLSLQALPSRLGLRESRHVRCRYQLTGEDVLWGRDFADRIANGTYRVDIHHHDKAGVTLRYLDGREERAVPGLPKVVTRWRPVSEKNPPYYQIPLGSMLPAGPYDNLIVAGRMIDADPLAHAAIRVMVNMNQTGEAAGVAAWLALQRGQAVAGINPVELRRLMMDGGSLFPPAVY